MYRLTCLLLALGALSVAGMVVGSDIRNEFNPVVCKKDKEPAQVLEELKWIESTETGHDQNLAKRFVKISEVGANHCFREFFAVLDSYIQYYNTGCEGNIYRYLKHYEAEHKKLCVPLLNRELEDQLNGIYPTMQKMVELIASHVQAASPGIPNHLLASVTDTNLAQGIAAYIREDKDSIDDFGRFKTTFLYKAQNPCQEVSRLRGGADWSTLELLFEDPNLVSLFTQQMAKHLVNIRLCQRIISTGSLIRDVYQAATTPSN